jgi:hypothetical protein
MFLPFNTRLAGVSFGECQENIKKWGYDDIRYFSLEREPENPHDPNAIGVWFLDDRLGYLQGPVAKQLAPIMDQGIKLTARFVSRNEYGPDSIVGLTVEIIEDGPVRR